MPENLPKTDTRALFGGAESAVSLGAFCDRVRSDESLAQTLRQTENIDEFVAVALREAAERGLHLTSEALIAAIRGSLPGAAGLFDPGDQETELPPRGWLPAAAFWRGSQLYVKWSYFGERRLTEPFFEGDVQRGLFKPFNRLIRYCTPIERLGQWLEMHPPIPPKGFIFHMSRCGSTLVSQMLAAVFSNIVVSEASPVDAVVRARLVKPSLTEDQQELWLRWIIGALGQPRTGSERNLFIKLDCWHTLELPLFARIFPTVPWVFLYRDPVEVLVSQMRMPGMQMIPGVLGFESFGIEVADRAREPEDFCAHVLARICEPVLQHCGTDKALLVNYRELPQAVWQTILPHFGAVFDNQHRAAMEKAARYDAKTPIFEFKSDIESKQREASASVRAAAQERLGNLYSRLEAARQAAVDRSSV